MLLCVKSAKATQPILTCVLLRFRTQAAVSHQLQHWTNKLPQCLRRSWSARVIFHPLKNKGAVTSCTPLHRRSPPPAAPALVSSPSAPVCISARWSASDEPSVGSYLVGGGARQGGKQRETGEGVWRKKLSQLPSRTQTVPTARSVRPSLLVKEGKCCF